jgi:hypothetical protein
MLLHPISSLALLPPLVACYSTFLKDCFPFSSTQIQLFLDLVLDSRGSARIETLQRFRVGLEGDDMGPLMTALVLKALGNGSLKEAISEDGVQLDRLSNEDLERELEGAPLLARSRTPLSAAAAAGKAGYGVATKLSSAVSGASSAAAASLKVHSTVVAVGTVGAAAVAAPALGVVALGKLVAHLVRFWKTQKHVNQLVIIYFMALDAGESDEVLLDAMVYAMQQKKVKLDRNGVASVIPGLVELEKGYNGITKLLNGVKGLERTEQAGVLYQYSYVKGNEWAKRTVAELLGGMPGKGLDETPNVAGSDVDVFAMATSSDDPIMDSADDDEAPAGAAPAVPKPSLFSRLFGKSDGYGLMDKGKKDFRVQTINKIADKLKSS